MKNTTAAPVPQALTPIQNVIFVIPNLQHLPQFKECLRSPRKVILFITELLKVRKLQIIYNSDKVASDLKTSSQSALISITVPINGALFKSYKAVKRFFIKELIDTNNKVCVKSATDRKTQGIQICISIHRKPHTC